MNSRTVPTRILASLLLLAPLAAVAEPSALQEGIAAPQQDTATPQQDTATPQQEPATPEQEPATPEQPQPIPEGEIPSRADLVAADLRRIETLLQPMPDMSRIENALIEREAAIVALLAELDAINASRISMRHLEDQRLPWLELGAELDAWGTIVGNRFSALQTERERLRDERAQWEATAAAVDADELAPELLRRIDTTGARVRDVEARVRDRRNAVGAIASRIAKRQEVVADSQDRLDVLAEGMRGRLFVRDVTPLWRPLGTLEARSLPGEAIEAGRDWGQTLVAYAGLRRGRVIFLLAVFVGLLLGALELRRQSRGWPADDEASGPARRLMARPFSVAPAFALTIGVLILPFPVGAVTDVLLVLSIVPITRIGSVVLGTGARRALYGVVTITVLGHIASLGPDGSPMTRILFLILGVVAFAGTAWTALHGRRSAGDRDGWQRAAHAVAAVAAVLLGVAVGANVLGWLGFARLLTEATVASLFAAFGWAIVVAAAAALLPVVFDGRLGRALPSLRRNQKAVFRTTMRVIAFVAVIAWAYSALTRFQIWAPLRNRAAGVAAGGFSVGSLTLSTGGILGAVLILVTTSLVAKLVGFALREEVLPRLRMRRGEAHSVVTLANYTVYGIGIVLAASAMGLAGAHLAVVVGAFSVGIGFGLQTIVNNFVSGLILIFERPISVGDTVQTVNHWGRVERIGIRASTIRSFDGAEIVVPNGELIAKEVINWTRSDELRRLEVPVGVAYGTDPERVLKILRLVAGQHPQTLVDPEPKAQMISFGESSLDFRLRCWTRVEDWVDVVSDLHVAINKELKEAGIEIPFPQRDLHVKSAVAPGKDEEGAGAESHLSPRITTEGNPFDKETE